MKIFTKILLFSCCFIAACSSEKNYPKLANENFLLGGIQVNEADQDYWTSTLQHIGMNTVSITIYGRHGDWDKGFFMWDTTKTGNVIREIKTAKAKGLNVVLIPRVLLDHYFVHNRFLWHGLILPQNDSMIQSWFDQYTVYVKTWATIGEELGVDVLAIGSEMRALAQTQPIDEIPELEEYHLNPVKQQQYINDRMAFKDQIPKEHLWVRGEELSYDQLEQYLKDEVAAKEKWAKAVTYHGEDDAIEKMNGRRAKLLEEWFELIAEVRSVYNGKLTYAANFDNYKNIAFWDKLDFIGINAYFKLQNDLSSKSEDELYNEIQQNWERNFKEILDFQQDNGLAHPVIFTELGYIYRENCTVMPWEGFGFSIAYTGLNRNLIIWQEELESLTERALAIKALHETNEKYGLLQGLLYWKLSTYPPHREVEPFVMIVDSAGTDPMQGELLKFVN